MAKPSRKRNKRAMTRKAKTTRARSRVVSRKRVIRRRKRIIIRKRRPPTRKRRTPPRVEYSVNVSYKNSKRPTNAISFQMSVFGPPQQTKDQVIDVVTETILSEGEDVRKGWTVRIVSWKGGPVPRKVPWSSLAIIAGEPATRFRV